MPSASVVIATWNRAALLDECLRHLAQQPYGSGDEVLIVDNGSTDHTAAVVDQHACQFPVPLRRLYEPTPGKSHAIAAGLHAATGDLIVFTDDDVNVGDGWLLALTRAFLHPKVALAGGPVHPRWERRAPRWLALASHSRLGAPLGLLDYGTTPQRLGARTLLGANMALRRSVLDDLGGYAPHLGKLRGTLLSGEDHELCERVQGAGHEAWYQPDAIVSHWVPAERMRLGYFLRWFFWSGITNATMDDDRRSQGGHLRPAYLLRQFSTGIAAACASAMRGRLPSAVDRALDSAFAAGYAAARFGMVRTGTISNPARHV
ncbi:MAG: glycosyltransferase family 2 protein [Acidobacteria bacterium]|nr:glycosyltransferase family 2 protein [Acidobacteriota bacterium]